MSNAMSRSKSRWKGALLATVATAAITPLAAKAQSLTVGITTNPLGSGPQHSVYIDPYDTDKLYVYATVTGTQAPSATYVDGLDYLYYNVNATVTGAAGLGSITSGTLGSGFTANGAQVGNTSSGTPAVGSTTDLTQIAKPRASSNLYVSSTTNSGSNIIVSGNSVSFLVETLTYTPSAAAVLAHASVPGAPNSVAFSVSLPPVGTIGGAQYVPDNYFVGMPTTPGVGQSPSAFNTSTGYVAAASSATLTNALPGDVNLDGIVNIADFNILGANFGTSISGWTNGDLDNNGIVNIADFNVLGANFGNQLGAPPSLLTADPTAQIGSGGGSVPEPTSGLLLAGASLATLLRRKNRSVGAV